MDLTSLLNFKQNKFVVTVGDDGAIINYFQEGMLKARLFARLNHQEDYRNIKKLFAKDTKAGISILVDVIDQTCNLQSLPAVSRLSVGKLVESRLRKDFAPTDLKGAILMGREKTGRQDWNYIFVSAPLSEGLEEWINFFSNFPNEIKGIFMLPVESVSLVKRLETLNPGKEKSRWQFLVSHNRLGGFRLNVYLEGKLFFTRLVHASLEHSPEMLAGSLEQEILNTLEYLRRTSLEEDETVETYAIVSHAIKQTLETMNIAGARLQVFSPYDVSQAIDLPHAAKKEDRFADIILATSFIYSLPVIKCHTRETQKLAYMSLVHRLSLAATATLVPLILFFSLMAFVDLLGANQKVDKALIEKKRLDVEWAKVQKDIELYQTEDKAKINDIISLYKLLSGESFTPLTIAEQFGNAQGEFAQVRSFNWQFKQGVRRFGKQEPDQTYSMFSIDFINDKEGFDQLFEDFDSFTTQLKETFAQYDVEYSRLPEKLSFKDRKTTIPIKITITGPKPLDAKHKRTRG